MCTIKSSTDSHFCWKKYFHKKPLYFKIIAEFEAGNEIDGSNVGKKTTNIYKQNLVLNGYYVNSEVEDVLKSGYYESPLGYNNVDWFVNGVKILQNKIVFYFKNTKKNIVMTEDDEEGYRKKNICRFCEKNIES